MLQDSKTRTQPSVPSPSMRGVIREYSPLLLQRLAQVLCAACMLSACTRTAQDTGPKLAADAPLPTQFPRTTKLRLGDPMVQLQLTLNGELAQLPFDVEWHNVSGGPGTLEAFRGDALDGGAVGDTPPIHAAFTGLDVKIVSVMERSIPSTRLALAPHAGIKQRSDIKGKRVAYSPGQAQGALILRMLRQLGLTPDQVTLVELYSREFKDALASDQVDVAPLSGQELLRYLKAFGSQGASSIDHGVPNSTSFYYVRGEVLRDPTKAAALRAYVRARTRAQLWAADHPQTWIQAYFVKDQHLTEEEGQALLSPVRYPSDWTEAIAHTQDTADLIAQASGRPTINAGELFDLRFSSVSADAVTEYRAGAAARSSTPQRVP